MKITFPIHRRLVLLSFLCTLMNGAILAQQDTLDASHELPSTIIDVPPPPPMMFVRVRVPGTRLSIVPPYSFKLAKNLTGLEKDASTAITVMDIPGGNFYTNTANYTRSKFEGKGLDVLEFEHLTIDGYSGIQALIKSPVDGSLSCQLVFGDTTFSVLVASTLAGTDTASLKAIERALSTVTYDKDVTLSPYEGTGFRLNDRSTEFKYAQKGGGVWLYSRGGISKTTYDDDPILMALPIPFESTMSCPSIAGKMIAKLEEKGFKQSRVENVSTDKINGFDAFEAEYYGTLNESKTLIYIMVVAQNDRAVVLEGRSNGLFPSSLKAFKELARTVSFQ